MAKRHVEKVLFNTEKREQPIYTNFPNEFKNFKNIFVTIGYHSRIIYLEYDSVTKNNKINKHICEFNIVDIINEKIIIKPKKHNITINQKQLLENTGDFIIEK